jgi:GntR family transcriptional regulator of vanillate catabolism
MYPQKMGARGMTTATSYATHTQRALTALRQRIFSGALPGGMRLFEVSLAEQLAISRTPVRTALSQLAEEGLLDRVRGGGFVVRSFAPADVVDTIELRGILEGTAARLAAERGVPPEALAEFAAIVAALELCVLPALDEIDIADYARLNTRFHDMLAALGGSAVIRREIERVTRLPFASPSAFLVDHVQIDQFRRSLIPAQEQHRALLEAIRAGEGARAEALAREHARAARRNVETLLAAGPDQRPAIASLALITA